jgi:hypothetical protein
MLELYNHTDHTETKHSTMIQRTMRRCEHLQDESKHEVVARKQQHIIGDGLLRLPPQNNTSSHQ